MYEVPAPLPCWAVPGGFIAAVVADQLVCDDMDGGGLMPKLPWEAPGENEPPDGGGGIEKDEFLDEGLPLVPAPGRLWPRGMLEMELRFGPPKLAPVAVGVFADDDDEVHGLGVFAAVADQLIEEGGCWGAGGG